MNTQICFYSLADAKTGLKWLRSTLQQLLAKADKYEDPKEFKEETEDLIDIINNLLSQSKHPVASELLEDLWERIILLNEEEYSNKSQKTIVWGQWRTTRIQEFDFGYTEDSIAKSLALKDSENKINLYKKIPPSIKWVLKKVQQKNLTFYTAVATIEEIEQVTSVPSLPNKISSVDAGMRILDRNYKDSEWQRKPEPTRIQSIKQFVEIEENIVANAPMLFIKDAKSVKIVEDEDDIYLIIDFDTFLVKSNNKLNKTLGLNGSIFIDHIIKEENVIKELASINNQDDEDINAEEDYISQEDENINHNQLKDCRPIWLIDGQHRVRGLSRSQYGSKLRIPIIIFPAEFEVHRAAKIFAEINTLQVSLTPLHKLFMQHRFRIPSPSSKRNFEPWEDTPHKKMQSRANNMAYELLAKLASRDDSALKDKVKLLDQNGEEFYVKADQWVNFARSWFLAGGPYDNPREWGPTKSDIIYHEVNSYFKAFIETVNHSEWADEKKRWPSSTRGKSLLQSATHFRVLIRLYTDVYVRIKPIGGPYNITDFKKVLKPFKWVDWIDNNLKKKFGGGGEKGRTNLYVWMKDALKSKISHPYKEVMAGTKKFRSVAGAGIMASPASSPITYKGSWPTKKTGMRFESPRPINARSKPTWIFYDQDGSPYTDILKINNEDEKSTCFIDYSELFEEIKSFKVSVQWANATEPDGYNEVLIKKQVTK